MAAWMWLVAGPNGAGKSSFAGVFLDTLMRDHGAGFGPDGLVKLNADERTIELQRARPDAPQDALNLQAARDTDARVAALIAAGRNFVVETVLSSGKYRDDVVAAVAAGFRLGLVYVSLHPPELSPLRVGTRVAKGGHAVDPATAIARYHRSHEQLRWFAPRADFLRVYDNSGAVPVVLAWRGSGGPLRWVRPGLNPAVDRALAGLLRGAAERVGG